MRVLDAWLLLQRDDDNDDVHYTSPIDICVSNGNGDDMQSVGDVLDLLDTDTAAELEPGIDVHLIPDYQLPLGAGDSLDDDMDPDFADDDEDDDDDDDDRDDDDDDEDKKPLEYASMSPEKRAAIEMRGMEFR